MNHVQITKMSSFKTNDIDSTAETAELTTIPSDVQHALVLNSRLPAGKFQTSESDVETLT